MPYYGGRRAEVTTRRQKKEAIVLSQVECTTRGGALMPLMKLVSSIRFAAFVRQCLEMSLLLALFATAASAQTSSTDGATPLALTPGAPAGSYPLDDFENIGHFNGSLNFQLPLHRVGGRGGASYTMPLTIEQHWRTLHIMGANGAIYNWWLGIQPGYSPGVLHGRPTSSACTGVFGEIEYAVTRLTFTEPNGTEHELRDQLNQGALLAFPCYDTTQMGSRGTVFFSVEGEAMTFVSDTTIKDQIGGLIYPSGYLMFRDGTRYRIDSATASWIRDRNGNKVSFSYDTNNRVVLITDSLNRQITITYDVNDGAPYGICDRITFKGFGGATRIIRVSKGNLDTALRPDFTIKTGSQLFPELNTQMPQNVDPTVVTALWLPNGRNYQFLYNSFAELARVVLPTGGAYEYDYNGGVVGGTASGVLTSYASGTDIFQDIYRRVIERRIYPTGGTGGAYSGRITYSLPTTTYSSTGTAYIESDHMDANGAVLAAERHYYNGIAATTFADSYVNFGYTAWDTGREIRTERVAAGGGATVLLRKADTWQQRGSGGVYGSALDPRITQTVTTLADTNQVSQRTFSYDQYNNKTDTYEYAFG